MKTIKLSFLRDELIDDITNIAFVEGDVIPNQTENNRHQTIDIAEDENINRVTRILNLVFAEIVETLFPLTNEAVGQDYSSNDELTETSSYDLYMNVKDNFSLTTINYLKNLIHELMVARVLAEWLSITDRDAAEKWQIKSNDVKDKIISASRRTIERVHLKMQPW